jgi:2-keto-4-pentenoate hydratase/2-oxohepta-3-ene-1,7-dioic acid hydratase in catechol pathway
MRIARFEQGDGAVGFGMVQGESLLRLPDPPGGALEGWLPFDTHRLAALKVQANAFGDSIPLASVRLLAPLTQTRTFLGIGGNYASHLAEIEALGITAPSDQLWFNKQVASINGPYDPVVVPRQSATLDYEGELGVVIGATCRNVAVADALAHVAGYLVCNDFSVRAVQMRSVTMTLGKSFETHGPIGPWLVTADEIPDPQALDLRTLVNGELRQSGSTAEMRYSVAEQIAFLSAIFTLRPGDILATGTPAGVAAAMTPPRFLMPGDIVRVEIDRVGAIENVCIADPYQD